jgi:hypothetical protein
MPRYSDIHTTVAYLAALRSIINVNSFAVQVDMPVPPTKFVNLKHLDVQISGAVPPSYDYFSLASFLDVCPSLETWYLDVRSLYKCTMYGHFRCGEKS